MTALVNHRGGDVDYLRETDDEGEARVFPQVQVLIGDRRNRGPERLRKDDKSQLLRRPQPEGLGGLLLAFGHSEDAAAHDLSDEGRRVEREPQKNPRKLGTHLEAAYVTALCTFGSLNCQSVAENKDAKRHKCENDAPCK